MKMENKSDGWFAGSSGHRIVRNIMGLGPTGEKLPADGDDGLLVTFKTLKDVRRVDLSVDAVVHERQRFHHFHQLHQFERLQEIREMFLFPPGLIYHPLKMFQQE